MFKLTCADYFLPGRAEGWEIVEHPYVAVENFLQSPGEGGFWSQTVVYGEDGDLEHGGPLQQILQMGLRGLGDEPSTMNMEHDCVFCRS